MDPEIAESVFVLCILFSAQTSAGTNAIKDTKGHIHVAAEIIDFKYPSGNSFLQMSTSDTGKCCGVGFSLCMGSVTGKNLGDCEGMLVNSTQILNNTNLTSDTAFINFPLLSLNSWNPKEKITVYVTDQDSLDQNSTLGWNVIDVLTGEIMADVDKDFWTSKQHLVTLTKCASVTVGIRLFCEPDYFGPNCQQHIESDEYHHVEMVNGSVEHVQDCESRGWSFINMLTSDPYIYTPPVLKGMLMTFLADKVCPSVSTTVTVKLGYIRYNKGVLRVKFSGSCTRPNLGRLIKEPVTDMEVQHALSYLYEMEVKNYFRNSVQRHDETGSITKGQFNLRFRLLHFNIPQNINTTDSCRNEFVFSYGNSTIAHWDTYENYSHGCSGMFMNDGQVSSTRYNSSYRFTSDMPANVNRGLTLQLLQKGGSNCQTKLAKFSFDVVEGATSQHLIVTGANYKHVSSFVFEKNDSQTGVSVTLEMMVWCSNGFESSTKAGLCEKTCNASAPDCNVFKCYSGGLSPYHRGYTCTSKGVCTNSTCICRSGYAGPKCSADINECELGWTENRCNHGTCEDGTGNFSCRCLPNYTGRFCETRMISSTSMPLFVGNKRNVHVNANLLKHKLTGRTQRKGRKEFQCIGEATCGNGTLVQHEHETICSCDYGFKGAECQDLDYCASKQCLNDGQCVLTKTNFTCKCRNGFQGPRCESKMKCAENVCQNNSTCLHIISSKNYTCFCKIGYVGPNCEIRDFCEQNPCQNGAICRNHIDTGFVCTCPENYTGQTCNELKNKVYPSQELFSVLLPATRPDNVGINNITESILAVLGNETENCSEVQIIVHVTDHANRSTSLFIGVICDGQLMPSHIVDEHFKKQQTDEVIQILHFIPVDNGLNTAPDKMWIEEYWIIVTGIITGLIAVILGALKATHIVYRTRKHIADNTRHTMKSSPMSNKYVSFKSAFANRSIQSRTFGDLSNGLQVYSVPGDFQSSSVAVMQGRQRDTSQPLQSSVYLNAAYDKTPTDRQNSNLIEHHGICSSHRMEDNMVENNMPREPCESEVRYLDGWDEPQYKNRHATCVQEDDDFRNEYLDSRMTFLARNPTYGLSNDEF